MSKRSLPVLSAIALGASVAGLAQTTDSAFTATGTDCADVTWSRKSLEQYPKIAGACQGVVQRDGKYYVKFLGEVQKVANRGREITVDFKDGDRVTLNPPENISVTVNGRPASVRDLRRGDTLNFYVPQDQLAVQFVEGEPFGVSVPMRAARAEPERAALVPGAQMAGGELPRTASELPALGLCGLLLMALGAASTALRRLHRTS